MKLRTKNLADSASVKADVLLVGCWENQVQQTLELALGTDCGGVASRQAQALKFTGKPGDTFVYFPDSKLGATFVIAFGLGKVDGGAKGMRKALAPAFKKAKELKATTLAVLVGDAPSLQNVYGETVAVCAGLIDYTINHFKTEKAGHKPEARFKEVTVLTTPQFSSELKKRLNDGKAIACAVNLARDLSNLPANKLTPWKMVKAALAVAAASGGTIECEWKGRKKIKKLGMGALLAVSKGSTEEPYLIEMTYTPKTGATAEVLGYVGKSVTFDSGGLNLKTAEGMRTMKRDMAGGASVLAAMGAIAALELPISVKAVMAATENMPDGKSYKPGDVITDTLAGLSVEVDNTDAEGRLTLADAIEYAKRQGVTRVIDLATLTGSVREFGGDVMAGAFGNNEDFMVAVLAAAATAGELVGQLPMCDELASANDTDIADLKNSGGSPGSVTAAWFIRKFAGEEIPWVHLDIAGVSYRTREFGLDPKHSTGFGVRTLIELARLYCRR